MTLPRWPGAIAVAGLLAAAIVIEARQPRRATRPEPAAATTQPARRAPAAKPTAQQPPAAPAPDPASLAPDALSPRNASYSIDVRLDTVRRTLTGREVITWRNITRAATAELRLHLYWNAWRNARSTWLRELQLAGLTGGGNSTLLARPEADWAWVDVTAIRLIGVDAGPPVDLTSEAIYVQPDDGNEDDRTLMAVPLPREVGPGESVNVEVEWTSKIPRTFSRTGVVDDYYFIAQWFPKVAVLEDAGWNAHQFHLGTEFFSDYGVYDVRMTVPSGWILGATGREREKRSNADGTTTHRYVQADVHDFTWTTSPDYLVRTERFQHPTLPSVEMRLLLQPEHAGQADRHFAATRAALRYYGEWFGAYPYGHVTIVDPAYQSGAGGMEYPTLFTAGTRWLAPADVTQPEAVTVHEAGHQFWYGIVGNNEFEHAWLDEGLNTFSTARTIDQMFERHYYAQRYFGGFVPWVYRDIPLSRATDGNRLAGYRSAARSDPQATPTYRYWPGTGGHISYDKTALWLHMLERHLGWPTLQKIMATFFERWKFRHPRPQDFFAVANEVSGRDLTAFFDAVHRGSNVFDYGVEALDSAAVPARGFFDKDGRLQYQAEADADARTSFRTTVVVRRYGEAVWPVDVLVMFEDGEKVRERWDGRDRWKMFTYDRPHRARYAQVDPDRVVLLDLDITNNSRTLTPRADEASTKWMLTWMAWFEDLLLTYAFFV